MWTLIVLIYLPGFFVSREFFREVRNIKFLKNNWQAFGYFLLYLSSWFGLIIFVLAIAIISLIAILSEIDFKNFKEWM